MKNIFKIGLFAIAMLLASSLTYGQGSTASYNNTAIGESYSQMVNVGHLYQTAYATYNETIGTLKDTTSGTTALYLSIGNFGSPKSVITGGYDSVFLKPLSGVGTIVFKIAAYASTTTDTLTCTLQESSDGIIWTDVTQNSIGALSLWPTSGTTPVTGEWIVNIKYDNWYRIKFVGKAAKASRVFASYHKLGYPLLKF